MTDHIFTTSLVANKRLVIPNGTNSTSEPLRSLMPSPGALSYGTDVNLLYYGNNTDWVQVQGAQGPQGPQGPQGVSTTGSTGPTGFLPYGNLTWTLVNADGNVSIPSTANMLWNSFQGGGNVTNINGLKVPVTGPYLVAFGYGLNLPSSGQNVPQSISLCVNNNIAGVVAQYTLQERSDLTPNPAIYTSNKGQSGLVILNLNAGDEVNVINSTINALHFQNNVDGTYTINNGVGGIAAFLTLHAI